MLQQLREPGRTLSRDAYTSNEVFEADIRNVFFHSWLFVCHESQLPEPGCFLTYELANESIILTRDEQGQIRGMFNVCRHRGSRVVEEQCGKTKCMVCPYHQWVYGMDGSLRSAPQMNDQLDHSDWQMYPVRVENWNGFLYVWLGEDEPDETANDMLAPATTALASHNLANAKLAKRIDYDVPANWKLFMENYRECYHCRGAHPEFCATVPVNELDDHRGDQSARLISRENCTFTRYAVREGATTDSIDGQPVSIPFGSLTSNDTDLHGLCFYPGHAMVIGHDNIMAFCVLPISPTVSRLTAQWYVNADAQEGKDYEPDKVAAFWDVTNRQDIELCRVNQLGVNSRRYTPGPYSAAQEDDVEHFLDFYTSLMQR